MAGATTGAAALLPAILAWLVEWIAVPAAMVWLWLRWVWGGPVPETPGVVRNLDERKSARQGTAAGSAMAVMLFLILQSVLTKSPAPHFAWPGPSYPALDICKFLFVIGLLGGLLPRPVRYWVKTRPRLFWIRSFALTVCIASAIALFSLLVYFESSSLHSSGLALFSGLAVGYLLAPIGERAFRTLGLYP